MMGFKGRRNIIPWRLHRYTDYFVSSSKKDLSNKMRYTKDENYSIMNVTHLHMYSVMLFLDNPYFLHHSLSFFYLEYLFHFIL